MIHKDGAISHSRPDTSAQRPSALQGTLTAANLAPVEMQRHNSMRRPSLSATVLMQGSKMGSINSKQVRPVATATVSPNLSCCSLLWLRLLFLLTQLLLRTVPDRAFSFPSKQMRGFNRAARSGCDLIKCDSSSVPVMLAWQPVFAGEQVASRCIRNAQGASICSCVGRVTCCGSLCINIFNWTLNSGRVGWHLSIKQLHPQEAHTSCLGHWLQATAVLLGRIFARVRPCILRRSRSSRRYQIRRGCGYVGGSGGGGTAGRAAEAQEHVSPAQ